MVAAHVYSELIMETVILHYLPKGHMAARNGVHELVVVHSSQDCFCSREGRTGSCDPLLPLGSSQDPFMEIGTSATSPAFVLPFPHSFCPGSSQG